ncbi:hypothetical protein, no similarity [Geotrichum candidum]|uniref:Uncharacterized protein n=1 Tax=Geotrichum candidum TaxID=1173061 RepID=A0A0J9XJU9_GEOCN|nr:hypothetical protein, no similarity [Geotrichum candidum]
MGMPSTQASNALIYMSLVAMLALGLFVSWKNSKRNEFLSSNRTQRGLPLAMNFVASGL